MIKVEVLINKLVEKLGGDPLGGKIFVTDVQTAVDLASKGRGESAI
jgi:nitrogen regulatory protein PII